MALLHGGQLATIAKKYRIPECDWLDLSTGIAPFSYPSIDVPSAVWQKLPTISQSLIEAAKAYYQADHCWPLSGSQQLIEQLPALWSEKCFTENRCIEKHVYLPLVGYKEHQQSWQKAGYQLHFYQAILPEQIEPNSVVVVINPNNPTNTSYSVHELSLLQEMCNKKQALLVIDEAFADIYPDDFSFVKHLNGAIESVQNVIVLRSIGKFFGLAGLRIGFVCSSKEWCEKIRHCIGPWSINGIALYVVERALKDRHWQQCQRARLQQQSKKQLQVLKQCLPHHRIESNALFQTVFTVHASTIFEQLCQQAVYVRLTDEKDALRFGIADQAQLDRLQCVLNHLLEENKTWK